MNSDLLTLAAVAESQPGSDGVAIRVDTGELHNSAGSGRRRFIQQQRGGPVMVYETGETKMKIIWVMDRYNGEGEEIEKGASS